MEGWIKLHRKFLEWEWFAVDEMVKLYIYLLLSANHENGKWRGIDIKRGQLITGINTLNEKTKISHQTLRTCLSRLEKTGEINRQSTNKYTVITICNYDNYQSIENTTNKQGNKRLTSNQQTTNKQLTTNNNDKEEIEKEEEEEEQPIKIKIINILEVENYFKENGYSKEAATKFFNYYSVAGWKDSKGNKVKSWKQKAQAVWFKDENKITLNNNNPIVAAR